MLAKRSYKNYTSWKKFQPFFPAENRLTKTNLPKEEYIRYKNICIHLDRYTPEGESKNTKVILVHGGGANGRLMSPIALTLKRHGYESISPDLPGFGLTTYNKVIAYQDWIDVLLKVIEEEYEKDKKPMVLVGISLGGMLAYQVACLSSSIKGLIVTTLADTTKEEVQLRLAKNDFLAKKGSEIVNKLHFVLDGIKIPIKSLTHMGRMANNKDFVHLLCNDKVGSGSWVYLKWLRTLQATKATIDPANFSKCPLLFLHPEKDELLDFSISKPYYDALACKKEMHYLTNCGHIPLEEPGVKEMEFHIINFLNQL